jgi:hypothetical protein
VVVGPVVDVILLGVPVPLWAATDKHAKRLLATLAGRDDPVATRLRAAVNRLNGEYVLVAETAEAELRSASVRGLAIVDLAYPVPPTAAGDIREVRDAYEEADDHHRATGADDLVTPPECVAFRRWYLDQIATQLAGGFPTAWGENPVQ